MYYLCRKNKGAEQLRGYCIADLGLCFRICQNPFSHDEAHMYLISCSLSYDHNTAIQYKFAHFHPQKRLSSNEHIQPTCGLYVAVWL